MWQVEENIDLFIFMFGLRAVMATQTQSKDNKLKCLNYDKNTTATDGTRTSGKTSNCDNWNIKAEVVKNDSLCLSVFLRGNTRADMQV